MVVPLLAGCVAEGGGAPAAVARDAPVPEATTRFDGWYRGRQLPLALSPTCRENPRSVWFRVENGVIEMRSSRHRHSAVQRPILVGTVSPGGEVALRGDTSDRLAAGQIDGDQLIASDQSGPVVPREGHSHCLHRYEAVRAEAIRR
jgi:hypothetical protein